MLSSSEKDRYSRQIRLSGFGEAAQEKLKKSHVLIVGAGALGCPVLSYLTSAGVGKITIVDGDKIELSNLHRQTLYSVEDIGRYKATVAQIELQKRNPEIEIDVVTSFLSTENVHEIASQAEIIIDGTDNFPTRYLVNDYCVFNDKTNVHGSIQQFSGQVSVFNHLQVDGKRGPNYRDIFPQPPLPEDVVSCAEGGVIGALPGIIGSMMAMECIKLLTGMGEVLSGKLWQMDSLSGRTQLHSFAKDDDNPLTGIRPSMTSLIDYKEFCGIKEKNMKSINCAELKEMMDNQDDFQLIDVREISEYNEVNLGGELIPLGEVPHRFSEISKDKKVVVHCKMGGRSANAITFLEQNHGYDNLYNLEGGIFAWISSNKG